MNAPAVLNVSADELARAVSLVEAHSDQFKILRRFNADSMLGNFPPAPEGLALVKAVLLDTETTGLNEDGDDDVVELAMIGFEFDPSTGKVFGGIRRFSGLEEPKKEMSAGALQSHHLTPEMLKGHRLNDDDVLKFVRGAQMIIAHNAGFDRKILERRFKFFEDFSFVCSVNDVSWSALGYSGAKLGFIMLENGFFFNAHRALSDCEALLYAISDGSNGEAIKSLYKASTKAANQVYAINAPYGAKDALKKRGYRWWDDSGKTGNSRDKAWWNPSVSDADAEKEGQWLLDNVYKGQRAENVKIGLRAADAICRYSVRTEPAYPRVVNILDFMELSYAMDDDFEDDTKPILPGASAPIRDTLF